jgi:hypothetical protein
MVEACKPLDIVPFLADVTKNLTLHPGCPFIFCAMHGRRTTGKRILLAGNSLMLKYSWSIVEALAGRFSEV